MKCCTRVALPLVVMEDSSQVLSWSETQLTHQQAACPQLQVLRHHFSRQKSNMHLLHGQLSPQVSLVHAERQVEELGGACQLRL